MRILYVHATFVPPPTNLQTDRFYLLSQELEGDVLQPVWFRTPEEVEAVFGPGSYPVYTVGRFRYHWHLSWRYQGIRQRVATFWFYLRKGLALNREHRYDCIVAYSHMTTGLCAGLLKLFARTKLIIEIVTAPQLVYLTDRPHPSWAERSGCVVLRLFRVGERMNVSELRVGLIPIRDESTQVLSQRRLTVVS